MNGLIPLLKKEILEQIRTHRLLIVASVFVFFGITTPLLLKYLPEIIKLSGENVDINFPAPTVAMSLSEYAGTIGQTGVLVAVLIAMGAVANELQRGTALMVLSKPVKRSAFVTAKFAAMNLTFLASLAIASIFCFVYTAILIGGSRVMPFIGENLLLALFLAFCIAVTLLFSCVFKSGVAAGGIAIGILIGQGVISSIPYVGDYMPGKLLAWGTALVGGVDKTYVPATIVTVVLTVLCLFLAQRILDTREI